MLPSEGTRPEEAYAEQTQDLIG